MGVWFKLKVITAFEQFERRRYSQRHNCAYSIIYVENRSILSPLTALIVLKLTLWLQKQCTSTAKRTTHISTKKEEKKK